MNLKTFEDDLNIRLLTKRTLHPNTHTHTSTLTIKTHTTISVRQGEGAEGHSVVDGPTSTPADPLSTGEHHCPAAGDQH